MARGVQRFPYPDPGNRALAIEQTKQLLVAEFNKKKESIPPAQELERLARAKYEAYERRFDRKKGSYPKYSIG